jgi:rhodanese-related sulfurtransferase
MVNFKAQRHAEAKKLIRVAVFTLLAVLTVSLCSSLLVACNKENEEVVTGEDEQTVPAQYRTISASVAKQMIDEYPDAWILDVRTAEEFSTGHIPNALLKPYDEIAHHIDKMSPPQDQLILIYCRSGRRSALAAQELADRGYTNIFDFGGINDWPYEKVYP